MSARRRQQHRVAALLDEIAMRRQRLYVLKAYGVRPAGARTIKTELAAVRDELAEVVDATATLRRRPEGAGTRERTRQVVPARRASTARLSPQSTRPGSSAATRNE